MRAYLQDRRIDTKSFQSNLEVHIQLEDKPKIENKINKHEKLTKLAKIEEEQLLVK